MAIIRSIWGAWSFFMPKILLSTLNDTLREINISHLLPIDISLSARFLSEIQDHLQSYEGHLQEKNTDGVITALNAINHAIERLELYEIPSNLAKATAFHGLKQDLISFIKQELHEVGIDSMHADDLPSSPLSELIANMSSQKINQLMAILSQGERTEFEMDINGLYDHTDDQAEAERFNTFLTTHHISFLGGGNSKNFKVENTQTGQVQVLKIDNRLDMPRNIEKHLRTNTEGVLAQNYAERQAEAVINKSLGGLESRTVVVTDFFSAGTPKEHADHMFAIGSPYEGAIDIANKMIDTYIKIQEAGCFFPDSKIENWLIDDEGKLIITDTKSFVFIDENSDYSKGIQGNERTKILRTPGYMLNDFRSTKINAEQAHAALLGRNIYTYLAGTPPLNPLMVMGGPLSDPPLQEDDFPPETFDFELGHQLKELILNLSDPDPSKRMLLTEAKGQLFRMQYSNEFDEIQDKLNELTCGENTELVAHFIQQKIEHCLNEQAEDSKIVIEEMNNFISGSEALQGLAAGESDELMKNYIQECAVTYMAEDDPSIIGKIEDVVYNLEISANKEVLDIISKFKKNGKSSFDFGSTYKAEQIEKALKDIPIKEREHLESSSHPGIDDLKIAIASKRGLITKKPKINSEGLINESDAADSFKNMKIKFQKIMKEIRTEEKPDDLGSGRSYH